MKVYHIEVEEILQEVYDIEANSLDEALEIAEEKYHNEEIVLAPETIKETNFREYKEEIMKDKNKNKAMER